jgi:zinc D-Ala-D-Ala carboxypeptidase
MQVSKHFSLAELTASDTAAARGIDNTPDDEELHYLARLCDEILEPLRERLGPIQITSGYRCIALNRAIGSKDTSHHVEGRAADIRIKGAKPSHVCEAIAAMQLPYQQCIDEGTWTHVSIPRDGEEPKRQTLTAIFGEGPTQYRPGFNR